MLPGMQEEGWFKDPYGVHTDRWYSDGRPTLLVRDDGVESRDQPPTGPILKPTERSLEGEPDLGDLQRADAAERVDQSVTRGQVVQEVLMHAVESGLGCD